MIEPMPARKGHGRSGCVDELGMAGSGLCALHCVAGPVLALGPWLGGVAGVADTWVHAAFAAILVPLTLHVMQEGSARVRALLGLGAVLVMLALVGHQAVGHAAGTVLTLTGSACLLLGHQVNRRRCVSAAA